MLGCWSVEVSLLGADVFILLRHSIVPSLHVLVPLPVSDVVRRVRLTVGTHAENVEVAAALFAGIPVLENVAPWILDAIGFVWGGFVEAAWEAKLQEVKVYKKKYGNCYIPADGSSLANWCVHQRVLYRKGKMSKDHISKLNKLGFVWKMRGK